jgi:hypothetical protein
VTPHTSVGLSDPTRSTCVVTIAYNDCLVTYICVAEYGIGLAATLRELVSMNSLNTTGRAPLTDVFSLMQLYLPFIVVVLVMVSPGNDSLNHRPKAVDGCFHFDAA